MKLSRAINRYVVWKHLRGVRFLDGEHLLKALLRMTGDCSLDEITSLQVTSYLQGPKTSSLTWWAKYRRLKAFFRHWMIRGELDALPIPLSRPAFPPPFKPFIYSKADLRQLLAANGPNRRGKPSPLDPITLRTIVLFLYGTGALISEALALAESDVDLQNDLVTLRRGKTGKRTIPIGPSVHASLSLYLASSAERRRAGARLFIDKEGRSLNRFTVSNAFHRPRRVAAIRRFDGSSRLPCLRDLRHTFAVHCLDRWLKEGKDLRRMLPALSAYMGHTEWGWTEQYLSMTPERFWKQLSHLGLVRSHYSPG
jgi:integrase